MAEATTTLADALLDDLDDLSDGDGGDEEGQERGTAGGGDNDDDDDDDDSDEDDDSGDSDDDSDDDDDEKDGKGRSKKTSKAAKQARLEPAVEKHLVAIESHETLSTTDNELIIRSNKHLANLAQQIAQAHRDLCDLYNPKFPELEELVVDPINYKQAVLLIGNEMDMTKPNVHDGLNEFLTSNQIITISVAGSTTAGRELTEDELTAVRNKAAFMDKLLDAQRKITAFVESQMESLAPSICALVGPTTAAKLLGLAGGLAELSKIPSCNLQVLGQVSQSAASRAGMSNVATRPHQGVLVDCALVQSVPQYLQRKALKVVAAKLALAARVDFVNVDTGRPRSAESGNKFRKEIDNKIQQWMAPDKAQVVKALPK